MLNTIRLVTLTLAIIALPLAANIAWADNDDEPRFKPLSKAHVDYGVSQFNYGIVPRAGGGPNGIVPAPMKLMNPNRVTQIAAVFVYNRSADPSQSEVYLGCVVRKVTPHGALDLTDPAVGGDFPTGDEGAFPVPPGFPPRYAEVIWAPEKKVKVSGKGPNRRRVADGLGGNAQGAVNTTVHYLAHPSLFSLPSNDVVPGQREAAVDCVCGNLGQQGFDLRTFRDFGVRCH